MPYKNKKKWSKWRKAHPENVRRINRNWGIRKHGITLEEFTALRQQQKDCCALCGLKMKFEKAGSGQCEHSLDHDHFCRFSKKHFDRKKGCAFCIRGILCKSCNVRVVIGLEFLRDKNLFIHPYLLQRPILGMRGKWDNSKT